VKQRDAIPLAGLLGLILILTLLGPAEKSLGETARIIYLHGALVWVAIMAFGAAALLGLLALVGLLGVPVLQDWPHRWCLAAGRVALIFWTSYLPLSMWAAQSAWGRVALDDPSFLKAFRVLAAALIVQVMIWLWVRPAWLQSLLNIAPFILVTLQLSRPERIMHPESPIGNSESLLIQVYFYTLSALCALLAVMVGRVMLSLHPGDAKS